MTGKEMILGFDVVKFICENYRKLLVIHIAEKFKLPVESILEVYDDLGITPLIITEEVKKNPQKFNLNKVKKNLGEKIAKTVIRKITKSKVIIRCPVEPNRVPIVRPPSVYTNSPSPFGLADELHEKKLVGK